jgi:hypothetical protein
MLLKNLLDSFPSCMQQLSSRRKEIKTPCFSRYIACCNQCTMRAVNRRSKKRLTAGVAVESEVVLGAALEAGDLVLGGEGSEAGAEGSRGLLALKREDVSSKTSDVGSSHRGTRDGVGTAVEPSGEDSNTGGVNVDGASVVGKRGDAVRAVCGTDGEGRGLGGRRVVASILGIVTGGNSHENTSRDGVGDSSVDSSGLATSERHAANSTVGAAAGLSVVGNVVDTSNDTRVGSRTTGVENLDSVELGRLGDTVGLRTDSTSAVSTVAIAIGVRAVTSIVGEEGSTTLKLGVSGGDTSVDNVHTSAGAGAAVVGVGSGTSLAVYVGNTRQTPGRRALGHVGLLVEGLERAKVSLDNCVLLDVVNL